MSNHIALFAYHNPGLVAQTTSTLTDEQYVVFENNVYLNDAEFHYNNQTDKEGTIAWSGLESIYYWPITGSVVFAGYSLPAPATPGESSKAWTASYDLTDDLLKIEGYRQSIDTDETFDLLYFGRDGKSYNNRRSGEAVPLEFKHALSWITINVKGGDGALIPNHVWSITNMTLKSVKTYADFEFNGKAIAPNPNVKWTLKDSDDEGSELDAGDMVIYADNTNTGKPLTNEYVDIEPAMTVGETTVAKKGIIVIPQSTGTLSVTVKYMSPANDDIVETFDVPLPLADGASWEAGKHYIYNLEFSPAKILVNPSVGGWDPKSTDIN